MKDAFSQRWWLLPVPLWLPFLLPLFLAGCLEGPESPGQSAPSPAGNPSAVISGPKNLSKYGFDVIGPSFLDMLGISRNWPIPNTNKTQDLWNHYWAVSASSDKTYSKFEVSTELELQDALKAASEGSIYTTYIVLKKPIRLSSNLPLNSPIIVFDATENALDFNGFEMDLQKVRNFTSDITCSAVPFEVGLEAGWQQQVTFHGYVIRPEISRQSGGAKILFMNSTKQSGYLALSPHFHLSNTSIANFVSIMGYAISDLDLKESNSYVWIIDSFLNIGADELSDLRKEHRTLLYRALLSKEKPGSATIKSGLPGLCLDDDTIEIFGLGQSIPRNENHANCTPTLEFIEGSEKCHRGLQ